MPVSRDDLAHIADLARLSLDEARVPQLLTELNGILGHMEVLRKVKTTGVCGASGVGDAGLPLREDAGPKIPLARTLVSMAPAMRDNLFLVPRLATHEDVEEAATADDIGMTQDRPKPEGVA